MSSANGYSVVPVQNVFLPLRIVQMILTVGVFGIAAYHLSLDATYDVRLLLESSSYPSDRS
jgi:hypothetical protein